MQSNFVRVSKADFVLVVILSSLLCFLNLLSGTALLYSLMLFLLLLVSGITVLILGKKSSVGIIYAIFCLKSFWLAALLKPLFFEPFDEGLQDPEATLSVYLCGVFGIGLASILLVFFNPRRGLIPIDDQSYGFLRVYSISLSLIGLICWFLIRVFGTYEEVLVGGLWGLIKTFVPLGIVGLALFAFVQDKALYRNRKDLLLFAVLIACYFFTGVIAAGKERMMMPLLIGFIVALRIYGAKSLKVWGAAIVGILLYVSVFYPYAQYTRTTGMRSASLGEAVETALDISYRTITDAGFRSNIRDRGDLSNWAEYAPESIEGFGRMMFIGEADYLISQTALKQEFTGFETITHGFERLVPYFLHPNKPQYSTGAFLGYYADQLGEYDYTTQVAHGFLANFYNAFGMAWVVLSSFLLSLFVLGLVIFYWGRSQRIVPSLIIVVFMMQHSFVEGSVSAQIQVVRQPVNFAILYFALQAFNWLKKSTRLRVL